MTFVLDSTVVLAWLQPPADGADRAYAERVLAGLAETGAWVPAVWWVDLAHGIAAAERAGAATEAESTQFLKLLSPLPISEREGPNSALLHKSLELVRRYGVSAERAVYLALALYEGVSLATLDGTLRSAARQCGVTCYQLLPEPRVPAPSDFR